MPTPAPADTTARFDFLPHWYPLSPQVDLDPTRPTAVELLGRRFVVWKPGGAGGCGPFRVFLDLCPHRLAPLSEGRIDQASGQLMCSYHGWQFDGAGLCRRIPQADPAAPSERQAEHLCAKALPSREAQDLLWLWPDAASAERADATALPCSPWVDGAAGFVWSSVLRDLPYDWCTLIENVVDPAHVPFAHHGVQGNREQAFHLPFEMVQEERDCLEAVVESRAFAMATRISFRPPCHLEYQFDLPGGRRMGLVTYCLPVGPGRSRLIGQFPRDFARWQLHLLPRWWDHISNRNEVLDGDMVLLHRQERELERRRGLGEGGSWQASYRLPTGSDRMVIAFRRWLDRYGGPDWQQLGGVAPGGVAAVAGGASALPAAPQSMLPLTSEQLLDRYQQHTLHCASCRGALVVIQRLQVAGLGLFAFALSAAALLPDALRLSLGLPLVLLALAGLGSAAGLRWGLEPRFRYRPYDHTRR
jgi:phenylpropionate dioxygenase-like ring-hydroxylating dioxygenase large terminal subunit